MTKVRVHEVAKSLDKTNKEVIDFLRENNVEVSSHMSSLTDEQIEMVKGKFAPAEKPVEAKPVEAKPVEEKPAAPVAEAPAEEPKKKHIVQVFRPQNSRQASGRPGQGRPGQGRPGQGRPGQGRPGQGRPDQRRYQDDSQEGLRQGFSYGQPVRPNRPNPNAAPAKPATPVAPAAKPVVEKPVEAPVVDIAAPVVNIPIVGEQPAPVEEQPIVEAEITELSSAPSEMTNEALNGYINENNETKFCDKCGTIITDGSGICPSCSNPID
jgi:hypothetical protein